MKDENEKLLPHYNISASLNIVGSIVIDKWIDPKTKKIYVLLELNKELLDKNNK